MPDQRFGRKFKLPSTAAIKHQLLMMTLEDEIRAVPAGELFNPNASAALGRLRLLRDATSRFNSVESARRKLMRD
jgi:hypothetical protein